MPQTKNQLRQAEKLNKKLFQNKDLIIAVGGDGTFLMASHFIFDKTPILGVNSDPRFKEGFFMTSEKNDFERKFKKFLRRLRKECLALLRYTYIYFIKINFQFSNYFLKY